MTILTNLPQNLPLVQNEPLQNFTFKDQHLLKPPTVMGASKFMIYSRIRWIRFFCIKYNQIFKGAA